MQHFTLPGTDILTSTLGFGCASIMGRQGKRKSLNALACAYDNGIIHFDVARSYGFGEAEKLVGKFIQNKRDKICLTTKFGILPRKTNPLLRYAKPVVRTLMDTIPSLKQRVKRSGQQLLEPGNFSVHTARNSLHSSLSALGVETIDLFLLHDCIANTPLRDDLFDFLDDCIIAGKVRHYGLATDPASANTLLNLHPTRNLTLTQTSLLPLDDFSQLVSNTRIKARIVHSVNMLQSILEVKLSNPGAEVALPDKALMDQLRSSNAMPLLLKYASHKTCGGVTLMSSFTQQHIIQNALSVETTLAEDTLLSLDKLLFTPNT